MFGGRVGKDDPRTEAYGTLDEAVAALGLARAELAAPSGATPDPLAEILLRLQRGLFVAGAELAANPEAWDRLQDGVTRVDEAMVDEVETILAERESSIEMPREFVVPGASRLSAALEMARTVIRRAERRAVALDRDGLVAGPWLLAYLNRLADLVWVLARSAEQSEGVASIMARSGSRTARRTGGAGEG